MVLICISLMISDVEHLFVYLLAIHILLWKNVYSGPLSIFTWGYLFFAIELYEFFTFGDINSLSDIRFADIFSHSVGCLFILLIVSFAVSLPVLNFIKMNSHSMYSVVPGSFHSIFFL